MTTRLRSVSRMHGSWLKSGRSPKISRKLQPGLRHGAINSMSSLGGKLRCEPKCMPPLVISCSQIAADLSLERLIDLVEQRVSDRTDALSAWDEIDAAVKRSERALADKRQLNDELSRVLESVGIQSAINDSLETTAAAAELFLDRQIKIDAAQAEAAKTVKAKEEDLAARRRALEAAERREEEWLARFAEALGGTWLKGTALPANIGNMLDRLAELDRTLQSQKALKLRVAKMEEDRERFVAEVRAAGTEVGEPVGDEPEQCAIRLANRLEAAVRARDAKVGLGEDLQRLQDAREVMEAENQNHLRRKNEVLRAFGVSNLAEAVERDELLKERDRLRDAIAQLEDQMSAELATETAAQASSILDALDADSLGVEQAECEQRLRDLDKVDRGAARPAHACLRQAG